MFSKAILSSCLTRARFNLGRYYGKTEPSFTATKAFHCSLRVLVCSLRFSFARPSGPRWASSHLSPCPQGTLWCGRGCGRAAWLLGGCVGLLGATKHRRVPEPGLAQRIPRWSKGRRSQSLFAMLCKHVVKQKARVIYSTCQTCTLCPCS